MPLKFQGIYEFGKNCGLKELNKTENKSLQQVGRCTQFVIEMFTVNQHIFTHKETCLPSKEISTGAGCLSYNSFFNYNLHHKYNLL